MQTLAKAPYDLSGMRILLTGAKGGIGAAAARLCAALGAELFMTDRGDEPDWIDTLDTAGCSHRYEACDIADRAAVRALCAGAGQFDALILNAGVFPVSSWDDEQWEEDFSLAMRINVAAPAFFVQALLPAMKKRGRGRIVMLGSIAAHTGGTHAHSPAHYAASKGAVHTFVRWLARRAAPEVLVNGVAPGSTRTPMIALAKEETMHAMPVPRFATPEEIAWPLAFLCSPGASYICGTILDVNGGAYMG